MSGPSKNSSPSSGTPESLLMQVEQLRQEAADFQRTIEDEFRTVRACIEELQILQAKRRGHGRRMD
jgi:hypothetical protein